MNEIHKHEMTQYHQKGAYSAQEHAAIAEHYAAQARFHAEQAAKGGIQAAIDAQHAATERKRPLPSNLLAVEHTLRALSDTFARLNVKLRDGDGDGDGDGLPDTFPELLPVFVEALNYMLETFTDISHHDLDATERARKIGTGIRNYGFLRRAFELAEAYPQFLTGDVSVEEFRHYADIVGALRTVIAVLRQFERVVTDSLLYYGDTAFRFALDFYSIARRRAERGDAAGVIVFNALRPFFRRGRLIDDENPTIPEIESDVDALLHGRKDGRIVIEHESPRKTKGTHVVVDDVHGSKGMHPLVKATVTGAVCPHCNCENPHGHKFCCECGGKL
jgi:hypothetical protein